MTPIGPGSTIGILGGGQLGRMLALEGRRMGYRVLVLDPEPDGPAAQVADACVVGELGDADAALQLAAQVDVVTIETEHIPAQLLARLEEVTRVRPSAAALATIQDRLRQKRFLAQHGFPIARFEPVSSRETLVAAVRDVQLPAVLKTRREGYDGKGQAFVAPGASLETAFARIGEKPSVLEAFVPFRAEISVIAARGPDGQCAVYPVAENDHRQHVLHTTLAPARVAPQTRREAETLAMSIIEALGLVGVVAVEMFLLEDERLVVNEIAPRVHNSGHYTFGACATSQFEQHLRAICGLPLGDTALLRPAVMLNLLGDLWSKGGAPSWDPVFRHRGARLHLYGKGEARPGRKMGHVLILDEEPERGLAEAEAMLEALFADTRG